VRPAHHLFSTLVPKLRLGTNCLPDFAGRNRWVRAEGNNCAAVESEPSAHL
jgi:hypothetical protein